MTFRGSVNIKCDNLLEMYIWSNRLLCSLFYFSVYASWCGVSHGILGPSIWVFLSFFGSGSPRVYGDISNTFLYVCPHEILSNKSENEKKKRQKQKLQRQRILEDIKVGRKCQHSFVAGKKDEYRITKGAEWGSWKLGTSKVRVGWGRLTRSKHICNTKAQKCSKY